MLNKRSKKIRLEIIKLSKANGGYHYGGSFSCAEILINLYDKILKKNDKFILSKGHGCWGYYVLLKEKGLDPTLEGHPHYDPKNGVHWTTGSEGHGFPAAAGIAYSKKLLNRNEKVYVLLGDGELQEGTTWETLLICNRLKLSNLVVIVDNNGIQGSGFVKDILDVSCIDKVAKAIGWKVLKINGHKNNEILQALRIKSEKPLLIIAKTVKGKGVSFMENEPAWHAKFPNKEYEDKAIKELKK